MKNGVRLFALFLLALLMLALFAPVQAEAPDCAGLWFHAHTLEFAPGDWSPGPHAYDMRLTLPDGTVDTFSLTFDATDSAALHQGEVELRVYGLESIDGPVTDIHPAQDTVMELGWLYEPEMTREERQQFHDAVRVEFSWDGRPFVFIPVGPIVSFCAFDNPGRFLH